MNKEINAIEAPLKEIFQKLEIPFDVVRHPPLYTVEESQSLRGQLDGGHCKTLFLKDKKGKMALAVVEENKRVDLKNLGSKINLGRISFGSPELMLKTLGVTPGSVTPFSLINIDPTNKELTLVVDQSLLVINPLHFHPLHNEATVAITSENLLKFFDFFKFKPLFHVF